MTIKALTIATAMAFCVAATASAQERITVNIGSSHPEQNIWVYAMKNTFEPEVNRILAEKGDYAVDWNEAYGGTLYKFTDTREAVMDGIVDVGMVGTVWEGANMPLQNVTYFTPFATEDHRMLIEIFDDLSETLPELKALKASWAENGMVPLSSLITDSYDIYANFPVATMADLQNRRLNAPGHVGQLAAGYGGHARRWGTDHLLHQHPDRRDRGHAVLCFRHPAHPCLRSRARTDPRRHRIDVFRRDCRQ